MRYIEAPKQHHSGGTSIFLAGGISGCPDWQRELVQKLRDTDLTVYNPRRSLFPMGDKEEGKIQIQWEHDYLKEANIISFWFPKETLCPIVLFELGSWSMTDKRIFVGCHPDYQRKFDVEIQLSIRKPELEVVYDLNSLSSQIHSFLSCPTRSQLECMTSNQILQQIQKEFGITMGGGPGKKGLVDLILKWRTEAVSELRACVGYREVRDAT